MLTISPHTPIHLSERLHEISEYLRLLTPHILCLSTAVKGGKDKPSVVSHNNEKDFDRRVATWAQIKAEETQDLQDKVGLPNSVKCQFCCTRPCEAIT